MLSVEVIENAYPLKVICYNVRDGSGGNGRRRGGDGLIREYEMLCEADVSILSERRSMAPYGLTGGESGTPGENSIRRHGGREGLAAKVNIVCQKGDVVRIETPGGGGYGKPKKKV